MTLSTTASRVSYAGNGATTIFAFAFKIWAASNLKVYLRDNATLTDTLQTLTTHYTIDIATYPGTGNVVFASAPAAGKTVVIVRDMALTQELDLIASGAFAAENVETQLDKLAAEAQTLREMLARGLRLPVGTAFADLALPEPAAAVANNLLGVKCGGDGFEFKRVVDLPAQTVSSFMSALLDDTDAETARATLGIVDSAGAAISGTIAGTPDAITLTRVPALGAYATYQRFIVKATGANTIASPTLNVDGLGAKTITGPGGGALDAPAWAAGDMLLLAYDGAAMQLISRQRFADLRHPVNAQTGTSYTLLSGDRGKLVTYNNAAAVAVTLPQANSTTFANGWFHLAENTGPGPVTITPTTSTINGAAALSLRTNDANLIISDGATYRAISLSPTFAQVVGLTEDATPDGNADFVVTADTNALVLKKARPQNLMTAVALSKSGNYTVTDADRGSVIRFAGLSSDATLTLPAAAGRNGLLLHISQEDQNDFGIIVDPNAAEFIDGFSTRKAFAGTRLTICCDGTGWRTVAGRWRYFSGNQTITAAGSLTLAHGLGVRPRHVWVELNNTSAEGNYSVGDKVFMSLFHVDASGYGVSCIADTSNLYLRYGNNGFQVLNKTTGVPLTITAGNWNARFYAEE